MTTATKYVLRLQGHTARLNELLGHWAKAARLKKRDRQWIALESRNQEIPLATGKRRVSLVVVLGPRQRRPMDPDALWKSLLDSCVHAGLLLDDGPRWCILGTVDYERGPHSEMRVVLEDVE